MTQEEKQILFRDLCARLPYGVIIQRDNCFDGRVNEKLNAHELAYDETYGTFESLNFKPYLRPMSSMTAEEKEYIKNRWCYNDWDIDGPSSLWREKIDVEDAEGIVDYFNAHHFDYRGLIEKGLALEAPKDMYKTE